VFVACGTPAQPPTTTPRTQPTKPAPKPNPRGPSEPECDALFTHAFALSIAARQPPPPEADLVALRGELRPTFIADCRAGTRAYQECGLAAKTASDFASCK